jgi:serine/threonine protein kinase
MDIFGPYERRSILGSGTTGTVYQAMDTRLNRRVALQIPLLVPGAERIVLVNRFMRQCQILAMLTADPAVGVPILHGVGEHSGQPFAVREYVDGDTLERRAAAGTIDVRAGLGVIAAIASVVQGVHGRGFAHRNLTPANILMPHVGAPKLIGFGRVGFLVSSAVLPSGEAGDSIEVDVQALQGLLRWLYMALRQLMPAELDRIAASRDGVTAGTFGDVVAGYLLDHPM